MKRQELESQLTEYKRLLRQPVPSVVEDRLEETFCQLADMELPSLQRRHRGTNVRKVVLGGTAAAAAATVVLASAYVSPVMAQSLKRIPGVSSLFMLTSDLGLRTADEKGWTLPVHQNVTHQDITLEIGRVIYDGTRIAVELVREGGEGPILPMGLGNDWRSQRGIIEGSRVLYQDQYLSHGLDYIGTDTAILQVSNELGSPFPEQFVLPVELKLTGIEQPFRFDIPIAKSTKESKIVHPSETRSTEGMTMRIEKVEATPVTTQISVRFDWDDEEATRDRFHLNGLWGVDYELVDDQGQVYSVRNGGGHSAEGMTGYISEYRFDPLPEETKRVVIKPYFYFIDDKDQKISQYIEELEFPVALD